MTLLHSKYRRLYLMAERECCREGRVFSPLVETNSQRNVQ